MATRASVHSLWLAGSHRYQCSEFSYRIWNGPRNLRVSHCPVAARPDAQSAPVSQASPAGSTQQVAHARISAQRIAGSQGLQCSEISYRLWKGSRNLLSNTEAPVAGTMVSGSCQRTPTTVVAAHASMHSMWLACSHESQCSECCDRLWKGSP